jgi:hypothetical protein
MRFLNDGEVELVDPSGSYALGISGGAWKLVTPSDNSTYVIMANGLSAYSSLADSTRTYNMTPEAKGYTVVANLYYSNDPVYWDLISG